MAISTVLSNMNCRCQETVYVPDTEKTMKDMLIDLLKFTFTPQELQEAFDSKVTLYRHTVGFRTLQLKRKRREWPCTPVKFQVFVLDRFTGNCCFHKLALSPDRLGVDTRSEFGIQFAKNLNLFCET